MPTISVLKLSSMLTEDDIRKKFEEVDLGIIESIDMIEHTRGFLSYRNFRIHYYIDANSEENDAEMITFVGLCVT